MYIDPCALIYAVCQMVIVISSKLGKSGSSIAWIVYRSNFTHLLIFITWQHIVVDACLIKWIYGL